MLNIGRPKLLIVVLKYFCCALIEKNIYAFNLYFDAPPMLHAIIVGGWRAECKRSEVMTQKCRRVSKLRTLLSREHKRQSEYRSTSERTEVLKLAKTQVMREEV